MRLRTKAGLIAAALLVQGLVLAAGWFATFRVVQRSFARVIEDRTIEQNRELAERVAALFPDDLGSMIEYGSPEWERLQRIIESDALRELPAGGFACLVEPDGRLLCHPEIRRTPSLRGYSFEGKALLSGLGPDAAGAPLLEAGSDAGASGVVEFVAGDFHYVATRPLAGTGLRLLVHQPVDALVGLGERSTRWVMGVAALAMAGVLGVTGVGLGWLLRRYEGVYEALNRELREGLLVAQRIQQGALPRTLPRPPGFEIAGWSRPADETGGDTFDAVALAPGPGPACLLDAGASVERVALLLADATGHGVGPALAVTQLHAMTRLAWRMGGTLLDVARLVNEQLVEALPEGRFVTAVLGVLDARSGRLELLSAGQGPLLVWRAGAGEVERLGTDTYPLGVSTDLGADGARGVTLGPGDVFCAVSDGIVEAAGPHGGRFGTDRLASLLRDVGDHPADEIAEAIREGVERFTRGAPPEDDRTVLVVRRSA